MEMPPKGIYILGVWEAVGVAAKRRFRVSLHSSFTSTILEVSHFFDIFAIFEVLLPWEAESSLDGKARGYGKATGDVA